MKISHKVKVYSDPVLYKLKFLFRNNGSITITPPLQRATSPLGSERLLAAKAWKLRVEYLL